MLNYDDILQKKLSDLESGASLETVLQGLPEEAKEIEGLIRLAATVRSIPHPEPGAEQVTAQRQQVMAAAVRHTQPTIHMHQPAPLPKGKPQPRQTPVQLPWKWLGAGTLVAGAGAMVMFIAVALVGLGFWLSNRNLDSARVEFMNGQVQVATNRAGTTWKNLAPGDRLHKGDRLRTLGASNATLVFFEGTHTFVSANADLAFTELNGSSGSQIQVQIDQTAGETLNKVTPLKGSKSFFLVHTPSGTASVHGTSFNVKVSHTGQTQFAVDKGEVRVKNDGSEVTLLAGQSTSATPDGEIAAPTYQFSIQGSVTNINEETGVWTISGAEIKTDATTVVSVEHQLGITVKASGRILEDNTFMADTIEPASSDDQTAYFTGTLEKMDNEGGLWQVSGRTVKVTEETTVDANLAVNDPVKVTYNILEDGSWLALKIESLVEPPEEPAPTPTATADPNASPSYEFEPDEIETPSCGNSDFNLTGTLRNTADEAKDYAANVELGYLIDRGGEYVSQVNLDPASWERIDAGETLTFNIHVAMNDTWAAAPEDAQVKLRIFVASATNRPDHLNGRLTVTIESGCRKTPTPTGTAITGTPTVTPTGTLTPEITGTPTVTPTLGTPTTQPPETGQCTGANPHPTGMKLAQRYGVSYEEIMYWFCQHYGFGEIDMAYSLSRQSGKPVEEIFAMRASGMGWGNIKKAVLNGTSDSGKKNNDKGNGKGNKKDK